MPTLAHELHDLVLQMDRSAQERLAPWGLSYRRYVALVIVGEHPGLSGRDLAGGLQVSDAAVSKIVAGLAQEGLLLARPVPGGHRRALTLTPAGRDVLGAATAALGDSFDALVRGCGIDPAALAADIRRIRDALTT